MKLKLPYGSGAEVRYALERLLRTGRRANLLLRRKLPFDLGDLDSEVRRRQIVISGQGSDEPTQRLCSLSQSKR